MKIFLYPCIIFFLLQFLSSCQVVYRGITEPEETITPELLATIPLNKKYKIADKVRNDQIVWRVKYVDSAYVYGKVTKFNFFPLLPLIIHQKDSVAIQNISRMEIEEKKKGIIYSYMRIHKKNQAIDSSVIAKIEPFQNYKIEDKSGQSFKMRVTAIDSTEIYGRLKIKSKALGEKLSIPFKNIQTIKKQEVSYSKNILVYTGSTLAITYVSVFLTLVSLGLVW
ncbi:MAG: hypothetical protein NW226_00365 [Microscillaceae bacterium]|nr:hypothetical protein [Microscillaceae bacterium]